MSSRPTQASESLRNQAESPPLSTDLSGAWLCVGSTQVGVPVEWLGPAVGEAALAPIPEALSSRLLCELQGSPCPPSLRL